MPRDNQTTVKQRAARIPLDYFRRKSVLERGKLWLAMLAGAAGIGYVAWGAVGGSDVARHYSPGPLAVAHAMWDTRCDACHQSFVPLGSDAWTANPHASDQLCQTCHRGAEHSPHQIAAEVASCASCHREHQGRDVDLTRVADSTCTVCHANIASHMEVGTKSLQPPLANVTSFISDHPDFRSTKRSAGEIKFSHSRHMRPGLTFGLGPLSLKDLSPADREHYRKIGQSDDDLVTLDCASCHQLDRSNVNASASLGPVRPAGDYMLPISYDAHCQACHQLAYAGRAKIDAAPADTPRYQIAKPGETVPHGWTGERLELYVKQVLDMKFIGGLDHDLLANPLGDAVRQPLEKWRLPNRPPKPETQPSTVGEYLSDELQAAIKNLRLQCSECHQMSDQPESLDVVRVSAHPAWFEHARFDHAAHRAVSCQSCHGAAFPAELPTEPTAIKTIDSDVMIPGRKLCIECHSPASGSGTSAKGGARFDCVECHQYHNGVEPWHGKGAAERGATHRLQPNEFINGETRSNSK